MSLGLGITVFMFVVTYVPQAAVLTIFNGPLAFVTTVLLVLSESSTIFNVLSKNFLIDDALIDTFDGTLMSRNQTTLVAKERAVKSGSDPIAKLGKLAAKPFAKFAPSAIIRYFMYLPLNFIPIIGTVMFVILQGRKFGPAAHARYFQLKQMNKKEKDQFVERRKAAYARYALHSAFSNTYTNSETASASPPSCSKWSPSPASSSPSPTPSAPPSGPQTWKPAAAQATRQPRRPACATRLPRRSESCRISTRTAALWGERSAIDIPGSRRMRRGGCLAGPMCGRRVWVRWWRWRLRGWRCGGEKMCGREIGALL
jgi:hypothetical protein